MNIFLYFFFPLTLMVTMLTLRYLSLRQAISKTELCWTEVKDLITQRNVITLDLLKSADMDFTKEKPQVDNIKKYGKLAGMATTVKEKAKNSAIFRKNLAEFLRSYKDAPAAPKNKAFVLACRGLRDVEYRFDTASLKYNNSALQLNKMISGPFAGRLSRILKVSSQDYFVSEEPGISKTKTIPTPRDIADELIMALDGDSLIKCQCGLDLSIPSDFRGEKVFCQFCETSHNIPPQHLRAAERLLVANELHQYSQQPTPKTVSGGTKIQGTNNRTWGIINCDCGAKSQLSPDFRAPYVRCSSCGKRITPKIRAIQNV